MSEMRNSTRLYWIYFGFVALVTGAYMFIHHYVQDYSDPVSFVARAIAWGNGSNVSSRAPLYPPILYYIMQVTGRDWVFISNLPFVFLFVSLVGLLTMKVHAGDRKPAGAAVLNMAAIAAITVLVTVRLPLLKNLVNPFREPLAFSIVAAAVIFLIGGWYGRRGKLCMLLAGLCIGISGSIRETCVMLVLPVGLWLLIEMVRMRKLRLWLAIMLAIGGSIGIVPLLHQNVKHSGNALVPSYAARDVKGMETKVEWDIPIPGMSLKHFEKTGPGTVDRLAGAYGPFWISMFALGLVAAIIRRNAVVIGLMLPSFLMYLLFYSFYRYYKSRYVLGAEMFAIPIAGYGFGVAVQGVTYLAGLWRSSAGRWIRAAAVAVLAIIVVWVTWPYFREPDIRTKVWSLQPARDQLFEKIETPAIFMGHRHFCYRMAWLLDQDFYEYGRSFSYDDESYPSLDERLFHYGQETIRIFSSGNYYINQTDYPWTQNWLEFEPVFDFADLTVALDHYGRKVDGVVYRVNLWQNSNTTFSVERKAGEPHVLMLDMKRIWDFTNRTFCVATDLSSGRRYALSNEVQFLDLGRVDADTVTVFRVESDAPVPPAPYASVIYPNEKLRLTLGAVGEYWMRNYISDSLYPNAKIPGNAMHLYDQGTVHLPVLAGTNHHVFAEFHYEFMQDHPYWGQQEYHVSFRSDRSGETTRLMLPGHRISDNAGVPLGRGTGMLSLLPVEFETDLPGHGTQNSAVFWATCNRNGYVKISGAKVFTAPIPSDFPVEVDIGDDDDSPFIVSGFHHRERSEGRSLRWTDAEAVVRIYLPALDENLWVEWHVSRHSRTPESAFKGFLINGEPIPPESVETVKRDDGDTVFRFSSRGLLKPDAWNALSVSADTFNPSSEFGAPDSRNLGLYLDKVTVVSAAGVTEAP